MEDKVSSSQQRLPQGTLRHQADTFFVAFVCVDAKCRKLIFAFLCRISIPQVKALL